MLTVPSVLGRWALLHFNSGPSTKQQCPGPKTCSSAQATPGQAPQTPTTFT